MQKDAKWNRVKKEVKGIIESFSGKANTRTGDILLIWNIVALSIFGIVMVYDSSVAIALRDFHNRYYFATEQLKWLVLGGIACFITSKINYRLWKKVAFPMLIVTILMLLVVLIPGVGIKALGAKRWINFGLFVLQPAEVAKLTLIIYFSAWFTSDQKQKIKPFLTILGIVIGLIMLEPDLGTSLVIIFTSLALYFLSGAPLWQFGLSIPILATGVGILAVIAPYRLRRLTTFFDLDKDPLGASYQIRQAIIALGSGGLFGIGIGKSRQKYEYLPEAYTDSIFAIIGEELGLLGCIILIGLFMFLIWRGFRIARRINDPFGKFLSVGILSWIGFQAVTNMAAISALIPLTGIPLPLISYGGSSLVILLASLGILINISKHVGL